MAEVRQAVVGTWGLPREEDIRKLNDAFAEALKKPGTLIAYEAMAEVLNVEYPSGAFRGISARWKRELKRDRGIVLTVRASELHPHGTRSVGYYVADPGAKVDITIDDGTRIARAHKAAASTLATITAQERDELPESRRKAAEHMARVHAEMARRLQMETKTARIELHAREPLLPAKKVESK